MMCNFIVSFFYRIFPFQTHERNWQVILKMIIQELDREAIPYKIVGGASAVLQGVSINVNDIDFEMDREAVYRFGELFHSQVIKDVEYCEDIKYSSIIGKFIFNGLRVEIFANLKRKENGEWVDTSTKTKRVVQLDELNVNVSWLEEETIAYIRRGRMGRAADCLKLCDPQRMLSILRGEVEIGVL
jgi:hypothetical protein